MLSACTPSSDSTFANALSNSDGGIGFASIAINNFSPSKSTVVVKKENTENFLVAAVGDGALTYQWTVDGVVVGDNSSAYSLVGPSWSVGTKTLKCRISDSKGSVSQTWTVKVNGTPVVNSSTPSVNTVGIRRSTSSDFSVSVSDPNSDTLTYVWKLDGNEGVLTSTGATATYSPGASDVGAHTILVDIYDGDVSDTGTYKVTRSWTVNTNHFYSGCNDMDNGALTNRTCVYTGISDIAEGSNPDMAASSIFLRPSALAFASNGNVFIADADMDVVYYWNKSAAAVTVVGIDVPANSIRKVAGVGLGGSGASLSPKATRNFLNNPMGLFFDGTDLYISDNGNNLVRKVDSSNTMTTVLGGGTSHVDGVSATGAGAAGHQCTAPYGVVKSGTNLFVSCGNNNRVKRVDLTSGLAYTFAGNGGTGNPASAAASSPTDATNGTLNLPYGLALDSSGNLYISEYSGCRVRVVNNTAGVLTFYGTWTVGAGLMRTIVGPPTASTCSYTAGEAENLTGATDATIHNPRNIDFYNNQIFITQHSNHSAVVVNLTGSSVVYNSTTVLNSYSGRIIGNGTGGYLGDGAFADTTRFNTPYDIKANPVTGDLLIADYGNLRLRNVRTSDHKTELSAGNGSIARLTTAGNAELEVGLERLNRPRNIAFDPILGELFIPDWSNQRIRKVDKYGKSTIVLGTGSTGSGAEENEYPTSISMNNPSAVAFLGATSSPVFGGHIIFSDNANHRIRFWNRGTTNTTFFGVAVDAGKVVTIAGTGAAGNGTSGPATSAAINSPSGVATDGTNIYFSDSGNHCVKKIDSAGTLSVQAGSCGVAGNVNGAVGTGRLNSPQQISYYENGANKGIFIADTSNSRVRFSRIAGTSAIAGVPVSAGDTNTVACGGTYHDDNIIASNSICSGVYGVAVVGTKVCFTNFNYHNVRCVDAQTGIITTAMGPLQGIDDTNPKYFPGTAFGLVDQDNVVAAPGTEPALTDSFGVLTNPLGLATNGTNTIYISEWGSALVRKVVLP
jgi:hypothetical protein